MKRVILLICITISQASVAADTGGVQGLLSSYMSPGGAIYGLMHLFLSYKATVSVMKLLIEFSPDTLAKNMWQPTMYIVLTLHWHDILLMMNLV